jgi:uncharacterized protein involved in tolerance to divalent cations
MLARAAPRLLPHLTRRPPRPSTIVPLPPGARFGHPIAALAPPPPTRRPLAAAMASASAADAPEDDHAAIVAVLVTTPDEATAQRLADRLVGERLAACANVFCGGGDGGAAAAAAAVAAAAGEAAGGTSPTPNPTPTSNPILRSTYWWQGKLYRAEPEALMLLKLPARNLPALTRRVRELHPYDEPCVSALPVVGGSESYLRWVAREASASVGGGGGKEQEEGGGAGGAQARG